MIQRNQINSCIISCAAGALLVSVSLVIAAEPLPTIELRDAYPALKFDRPLWMEEAPDASKRLVVIEQAGKVWRLPQDRNGADKNLFLDISDRRPLVQNEEGLLAFAFHPQFKENGKFYIYYTQQGPKRNILSEAQVSKSDPNQADLATELVPGRLSSSMYGHGPIVTAPERVLTIQVWQF